MLTSYTITPSSPRQEDVSPAQSFNYTSGLPHSQAGPRALQQGISGQVFAMFETGRRLPFEARQFYYRGLLLDGCRLGKAPAWRRLNGEAINGPPFATSLLEVEG